MIRYAVAIVLTVALLGAGFAGLETAATANSERVIRAGVADLEEAAVSLASNDELPPEGFSGPRRFVTIEMPERSLTTKPLTHFELRRLAGERLSVVTFRVEGGPMRTETIDVPITNVTGGNVVELAGTEDRRLRLTLVADEDRRPLVSVVRSAEFEAD